MRLLTVALITAFFGQLALANDENKNFSGLYELVSCQPACDSISANSGSWSFPFDKAEGMNISLVDNPQINWRTCDGSSKAFEFNIWVYARRTTGSGYKTGPFMHNNLEGDYMNPWRNICDGVLSVSSNSAVLNSPQISITLKKISTSDFELLWKDSRLALS